LDTTMCFSSIAENGYLIQQGYLTGILEVSLRDPICLTYFLLIKMIYRLQIKQK